MRDQEAARPSKWVKNYESEKSLWAGGKRLREAKNGLGKDRLNDAENGRGLGDLEGEGESKDAVVG